MAEVEFPLAESSGFLVRDANRAFQRLLEKRIASYGVARGQWYFLRVLWNEDGLSQRELARRAGVTNGLISLIEQNRVSPSVGSLKKVLDGVPMSLAEFFTLDVTSAAQVFYSASELVEIGNESASLRRVSGWMNFGSRW